MPDTVEYANVAEMRQHDRPVRLSPDGYGDSLATSWEVRLVGETRWRSVWAVCYSNVASHYVSLGGERRYIRDADFPERS